MELKILVVVLIGYLLGSSNLAYYLSKAKNVDLKANGTGNYGTSNAFVLLGAKLGVMVAVHDIGKAVLSVVLAKIIFPGDVILPEIAGASCVLGHIFPFYIKFSGGKGLAPCLGAWVALNWQLGIILVVLVVLAIFITNYMVSGTMLTILSLPIIYAVHQDWICMAIMLFVTFIIVIKHIENFVNIKNGTEFKVRDVIFNKKKEVNTDEDRAN